MIFMCFRKQDIFLALAYVPFNLMVNYGFCKRPVIPFFVDHFVRSLHVQIQLSLSGNFKKIYKFYRNPIGMASIKSYQNSLLISP